MYVLIRLTRNILIGILLRLAPFQSISCIDQPINSLAAHLAKRHPFECSPNAENQNKLKRSPLNKEIVDDCLIFMKRVGKVETIKNILSPVDIKLEGLVCFDLWHFVLSILANEGVRWLGKLLLFLFSWLFYLLPSSTPFAACRKICLELQNTRATLTPLHTKCEPPQRIWVKALRREGMP